MSHYRSRIKNQSQINFSEKIVIRIIIILLEWESMISMAKNSIKQRMLKNILKEFLKNSKFANLSKPKTKNPLIE